MRAWRATIEVGGGFALGVAGWLAVERLPAQVVATVLVGWAIVVLCGAIVRRPLW